MAHWAFGEEHEKGMNGDDDHDEFDVAVETPSH